MNVKKDITDDYTFGQKIAHGSFGKVYTAVHKVTGAVRAVKKLKKKLLDQDNMKYILCEFEALKKLDHPNLVKLIDHYEDRDNLYLV